MSSNDSATNVLATAANWLEGACHIDIQLEADTHEAEPANGAKQCRATGWNTITIRYFRERDSE